MAGIEAGGPASGARVRLMHAAKLEKSARLSRVYRLLSDGREHSTREIRDRADVCAVSSIISELRDNGADIRCRLIVRSSTGERFYLYRLVRPVPEVAS